MISTYHRMDIRNRQINELQTSNKSLQKTILGFAHCTNTMILVSYQSDILAVLVIHKQWCLFTERWEISESSTISGRSLWADVLYTDRLRSLHAAHTKYLHNTIIGRIIWIMSNDANKKTTMNFVYIYHYNVIYFVSYRCVSQWVWQADFCIAKTSTWISNPIYNIVTGMKSLTLTSVIMPRRISLLDIRWKEVLANWKNIVNIVWEGRVWCHDTHSGMFIFDQSGHVGREKRIERFR